MSDDFTHNISTPADNATIGSIPGHIVDVKQQVATHLNTEHTDYVSGTNEGNSGVQHRLGSAMPYYQATAPTVRPGDGTISLTAAVDDGRLWVDSDDNVLYVLVDGDEPTWETVEIAGGVGGADVVLLAGRSGGQTIEGGTDQNDDLKLQATAYTTDNSTTAVIEFVKTDGGKTVTNKIEFNEIDLYSLKLGEAMDANSKKITSLASAAGGDSGDALSLGDLAITFAELSTTGGVGAMVYGTAAGDAANDLLTADLGFSPDLVVACNTYTNAYHTAYFWFKGMTTNNKASGNGAYGSGGGIRVADNVITFLKYNAGTCPYPVNLVDKTFWYFAIKFNKQVNPATA